MLNSLLEGNPESDLVIPSKPKYFKMCSVASVEADNIQLEMKKWPMTIMADGCSTNFSADKKISECFGLVSPSIRCVAHAADGSMKRLTNSKTVNVSKISAFVSPFCTIPCQFQQSGKRTCLLNEALGMLDMTFILPNKNGLSAFCMCTSS